MGSWAPVCKSRKLSLSNFLVQREVIENSNRFQRIISLTFLELENCDSSTDSYCVRGHVKNKVITTVNIA